MSEPAERPPHFIEQIVDADNITGKWGVWTQEDAGPGEAGRQRIGRPRVHTRFPPEPNGYLHIGHSKSICLNYGLAKKYGGKFNLRFDDTNPTKEEQEYVDAIIRDVKWLGADFEDGPCAGGLYFASNYFGAMYDFAAELIRKGKAYVCDLSAEEMAARRGKPGVPATSPFRDRPIEESLRLMREMKEGKHPNGSRTVRARIDLASPNFNLRDPVMYRIVHEPHHNTGDAWCIYPMYDWAHGLEDSVEGITHSVCTLEFEDHRPLYDWFIDAINEGGGVDEGHDGTPLRGVMDIPDQPDARPIPKIHHPQQIEFAKLKPTYTLLSKRNLLKLVESGVVTGWDDPRMPTISALRRRGFTAQSIRGFCEDVGVTKAESIIDIGRLENSVRDHLNKLAPRRMAVLRPLKVTITNWADGGDPTRVEWMEAVNNPEDPAAGARKVPFARELFIEADDFMENPPKKFFRLAPGVEVRLRYAYWVKCVDVVKNAAGEVVEVRCTYDPQTKGGDDPPPGPDGVKRKVKGTIHWVSAAHAGRAEVRLFDRLFNAEEVGKRTGNYVDDLNPHSLEVVSAYVEPALMEAVAAGEVGASEPARGAGASGEPAWEDGIARYQFERLGYFCVDRESKPGAPVFNRTVTLKDTWAKEAAKGA